MERRQAFTPLAPLAGMVVLVLLAGGCDSPAPVPGGASAAPPAGAAPPPAGAQQAAGAAIPPAAAPSSPATATAQPTLQSFLAHTAGAAPPTTPATPASPAAPAAGTAGATGTGTLEPEHVVAPPTSAELARKREEWAEHERMQQQQEQNLQEWRRSRAPAATAPVPKVGAAATDPDTGGRHAAQTAMRSWYAAYSARASAVTLALSRYGLATAEQPADEPRLAAACRELSRSTVALQADPRALAVPSEDASRALATAYAELQATAEACLGGRPDLQAAHFAAAHRALTEAAAALRPFGLAP